MGASDRSGTSRGSFAIEGFKSILERVFRGADFVERMRQHFRLLVYTPQVNAHQAFHAAPPNYHVVRISRKHTAHIMGVIASRLLTRLIIEDEQLVCGAFQRLLPYESYRTWVCDR